MNAICGQELIVIVKYHSSECFSTSLMSAQQPFSDLHSSDSENVKFKAGYTLKDVVAYRAVVQEFYRKDDLPKNKDEEKSKRIKRVKVDFYNQKGEMISDFCPTNFYVPINKITL